MWRYVKSKLYGVALALAIIGAISPAIAVATREIQTNICTDFIAPTITSPAPGFVTQDDTVVVTGKGEPSLSVTIIENGTPVAVIIVSSSGDYSVSVPLSGGANAIVAKEVNACGSAKESGVVGVQRNIVSRAPDEKNGVADQGTTSAVNTTPATPKQPLSGALNQNIPNVKNGPGLRVPVINEPLSGATYTTGSVWVAGTTEPSSLVTIYINGVSVARLRASLSGEFGVMVELREGRNSIQVGAEKNGKSVLSQPTVVTYIPSESAEKHSPPLTTMEVIVGATVATLMILGGVWVVRFINTRRHR